MNSSDSECFESADEEFELETDKTSAKPSTSVLRECNLKNETPELKKNAIENSHKTNEKLDKRKPKSKLGTKVAKPTSSAVLPKVAEASDPIDPETEISQVKDEPNLWEDDDWDAIPSSDNIKRQDEKPKLNSIDPNGSWSSWGTWGVSSLLSTASSITTQVSQGLTTVLESSIGAPDPVALAKQDRSETLNEPSSDVTFGISNFISGVSQITKLVETTGTKVISGGLDTLETIGKKTMEVLQDGDPGFKKKRAYLKLDKNKPVLSHILREAKEKAEHDNKILEQKHFARKANYEMLFDDHQGLVHLEALEMLSRQCDIKLQTIMESKSGNDLTEMQETMAQIKELCELNEDDDEELFNFDEIEDKLQTYVTEMNISIYYDKLISTWADAESWFDNLNLSICNEMELHEQAIDTLAQLTAISVEQFHKAGELLLIKQHHSTVDETDSLVQLTMLLTNLIGHVAKKLSDKLNEKSASCKSRETINNFITNIYFEAANSSSYIKNAFQLLIPVLQVGAI